jgi:hypothetical protein
LGPLAPSPAWTLVTPYCKRTRPGRGTNTKAAGFPPLSRRSSAASLSPLRARPRARPIWAGARGDTHSSAQGPPGLETPTLRMFLVSLVSCSMHQGVPFIALRQLGAVGDQFGRQFLPSVEWYTGQFGAPPDSSCSSTVRDLLPYRAQPTVGPPGPLAHRTLSGAHWTVWCAQPTVGVDHVSRGRPLAAGAFDSLDSLVNYSHVAFLFS